MVLRFSSYGTNSGTLASSSAAQKEKDDLYQRLLPYAPSTVSMTPIINQWVREGKTVEYAVLKKAIKQLRAYRRFKHALQVPPSSISGLLFILYVSINKNELRSLFSLILKRVES